MIRGVFMLSAMAMKIRVSCVLARMRFASVLHLK
jgi:hypothetical protein